MNSFEYASPKSMKAALLLLGTRWGPVEILAGGTDLIALMKDYAITPTRLVSIKKLSGLDSITYSKTNGLTVGALVTMDELSRHPAVSGYYPPLLLALRDAASPQIRNRATIGGNLCQRPRCWYFRNGYGLLALDKNGNSLVVKGDNRYHAILGNDGPAYFVSPSTIAPVLIAFGARVTLQGPQEKRTVQLADFYITPTAPNQREHDLRPNEILIELQIPPPGNVKTAYFEVRQKFAFDWPIATSTAVLSLTDGIVRSATLMLSHVAPIPWRAKEAETVLIGQRITLPVTQAAAAAALRAAKTLGQNAYKIRVARTALERAILMAAGLDPLSGKDRA